jgi:hypothetical protein
MKQAASRANLRMTGVPAEIRTEPFPVHSKCRALPLHHLAPCFVLHKCKVACVIKYRYMGTYGGVKIYLHVFLTSALDGGEWSASRPGRFTPGGKSLRYPLERRLDGPQSWSERYGDERNLLTLPGIKPWSLAHPARSLVTTLADISRLPSTSEVKFTMISLLSPIKM